LNPSDRKIYNRSILAEIKNMPTCRQHIPPVSAIDSEAEHSESNGFRIVNTADCRIPYIR
jgi:hypothetical protein